MKSERTTARIRTAADRELRRAVRDFPSVDVVDAGADRLAVRGDQEDVRAVKRALWTRELSAKDHGQDELAAADAAARADVESAA